MYESKRGGLMAEKKKIQIEDGVEFTKQEQQQVQEALDWLKNWLKEREKAEMLNGGEDAEDVQKALEKLDNMNVFIFKNGNDAVIKGLESGKLHLTQDFIDEYGNGNLAEALQYVKDEFSDDEDDDSKGFIAFNMSDAIEEPAIFINIDNLRTHEERLKTSIVKTVIIHEATHAINLEDSELKCQVTKLNENVENEGYWDSDEEVYARIMQMRQELNLDPAKLYTLDEVKEMRQKCVKSREYVADETDNEKRIDWRIFEKYTDEQILFFLNETSDNGKQQSDYDVKIDRQDLAATTKNDAQNAQMEIACVRELASIHQSKEQNTSEEKGESTTEKDESTAEDVRQREVSAAQLRARKADRDLS